MTATPHRDGAVDRILDHCALIGFGYTEPVAAARAEVAGLRERVARMEKALPSREQILEEAARRMGEGPISGIERIALGCAVDAALALFDAALGAEGKPNG